MWAIAAVIIFSLVKVKKTLGNYRKGVIPQTYKQGQSVQTIGEINPKTITELGGMLVKFAVDPDLCISCGNCIDTCPEVFDWNDDGVAQTIVGEVPDDVEDKAQEASENCPTDAISQVN